jgi:hypothetical protein
MNNAKKGEFQTEREGKAQSTYFTVRGQSYFSRLPNIDPPIPLSARRVCPPPATKAERGMEGQYFGRRET